MYDNIRKNAEGYSDPTAYEVLKKAKEEESLVHDLIHCIRFICKLAGYNIEGRITFVNRKTGQKWK